MSDKNQAIQSFETNQGGRIFQIPLNAFPGFWVYAYLVLVEDYKVLLDTGSNWDESNRTLEEGFESVSEMVGEKIGLEDLTHILVTHGHIDHFGGLEYIRPKSKALVGVHELDRRNLTNYDERLVIVAARLKEFLRESGVAEAQIQPIYEMYMFPKSLFSSTEIDFTYEAEGMKLGPFEMLHVPGHCAGMVMTKLHDVVFTADHILMGISPHQAPERLTLNTGLGHYLNSLSAAEAWAGNCRLGLGSHKSPIHDLKGRINEIRGEHRERLSKIIELLEQPKTIAEVSKELFGKVEGYNILLALEETGAHVEYLYQRGYLCIDNLEAVSNGSQPVAIRYGRLVDAYDPK